MAMIGHSRLSCPVCGEPLAKEGGAWRCPEGHSYDESRHGYLNLLLANQRHSEAPGDPRESLRGRQAFLAGGYYAPLRERAAALAGELRPRALLDAGTGTGYYLRAAADRLAGSCDLYGLDIGKEEARAAARLNPEAQIVVASLFHLPFADASLDLILSIFAPYAPAEFVRVLGPAGRVISVQPGAEHLYELKERVYAKPYRNEERAYALPGMAVAASERLKYQFTLPGRQPLLDLWSMTPYAHKTAPADLAKLDGIDIITVTADFIISSYRKEG